MYTSVEAHKTHRLIGLFMNIELKNVIVFLVILGEQDHTMAQRGNLDKEQGQHHNEQGRVGLQA